MPTGLYIAKRKEINYDDYGNAIEVFETPKKYRFFYMPVVSDPKSIDYQVYGALSNYMFRCFIPYNVYVGNFHQGDRAYLIDEDLQIQDMDNVANKDNEYCEKANYEIIDVKPQNMVIKLLFRKINYKGEKSKK